MSRSAFWQVSQSSLKALAESNPQETLRLLMSGGTQSLLLAELMHSAGISFTAHMMSFDGTNDYDLQNGIDYCQARQIPFRIDNFDFKKFFNHAHKRLAKQWQTSLLLPLLILAFREKVPSSSILLSAAFLPLIKRDGAFFSSKLPPQLCDPALQWLFFFQLQPEVRHAFLEHPRIRIWKELQPRIGFIDTHDWRETIVRMDWPDFQSPIPWTGYGAFGLESTFPHALDWEQIET